jgi:peptide/nickel transport system substrate-binding protein
MTRLTRREFGRSAIGAAAGAALAASIPSRLAQAAASDKKTLRFIAQSDLRVLDPIWTTAYITRNHGYAVFDTLFAIDAEFAPHPQMVGEHQVSADKLTYQFKLRDGLAFHDGSAVRGADCAASIKRWMARDALGQTLKTVLDDIKPDGEKGFTIKLKEPFPLLIDGLAKVSSLALFVMPERLADTDPFKQVTEMVGSGPFKFVKDEFQPGHKVVYVKNNDYVPRKEPSSWASGGKVVKVDRVEWLYIPDAMTKVAALANNEADWWENPPPDVWPVLAGNADLAVTPSDPIGNTGCVRFNHLVAPTNNVKFRQAILAVADQADYMTAYVGDPKNWSICASVFTCGTPMAGDAGSAALTSKRDFAKAKQLLAESGYKGEKVVLLNAADQPLINAEALITNELLKKLGVNVDLQTMDWGTLVTRRASKEPLDKGGWNIFCTGWVGSDTLDPSTNVMLRANGTAAWFGWPTDEKLESLRAEWLKAPTLDERKKLAAAIQERAFEVVPYIPTGIYRAQTAYRKTLKGVIQAPAFLMWNVEKV